jgi:Flp pilus assembly protein TadG
VKRQIAICEKALAPIRAVHRTIARTEVSSRVRRFGQRFFAPVFLSDEGAALTEIAITLPILLTVIIGLFRFGVAINNQLTLTQAVGTGAQYLQQIRTNTTDPCADTFTQIKNAAPYLNSSNISLSITMDGTTPTQTGNSCSGAQSDLVQGEPVTVTATYPCNLTVYGINYAPSCLLHAQVTEYEY